MACMGCVDGGAAAFTLNGQESFISQIMLEPEGAFLKVLRKMEPEL